MQGSFGSYEPHLQIQVKGIEDKQKEKVFHPFVLEFKIESEQDLIDLWCRFNLSSGTVNRHCDKYKIGFYSNTDVWGELDNLLKNKPYMK